MMNDCKLQTNVDEKYFKSGKVSITNCIKQGERYVFRVEYQGTPYVIKGYEITLTHLVAGDEIRKKGFLNSLAEIEEVYQEYYFSKMASIFSPHFVKPLGMAYGIDLAKNERSYTKLYIEILFEFGGESLDTLKQLDFTTAYNLMRQSANAICVLHSTGVIHLDIKPSNMVFSNNLLKIIDMGSLYESMTKTSVYQATTRVTNKIREFTEIYSPPEILKLEACEYPMQTKYEMGKIDVYSWAMCFFKIICQRAESDLKIDISNYKLDTEKVYENYISKIVDPELDLIKANGPNEEKIKRFIFDLMHKELSFEPSKRSKIEEIVARMKDFETQENIDFESNLQSEKIMDYLMSEETKSTARTIEPIQEKLICQDCLNEENIKVELECEHSLCRKCITEYVLHKFESKVPYGYTAFCNICKKYSKVIAILLGKDSNYEWNNIGKLVENKFAPNSCVIFYYKYNQKDPISSIESYLINDYGWFEFERSYVEKYLATNGSISKLDLSRNQIGDAGALAFGDYLKSNKTLTSLDLGSNQIAEMGAIAIAEGLKLNNTLASLVLWCNKIGSSGIIAIAGMLSMNRALKSLDLFDTQMGGKGAKAIAKALESNNALEILDIAKNQVTNEGGKAIAQAIIINKTLRKLVMKNSEIGDEAAIAIADALANNKTLVTLILTNNQIEDKGRDALADRRKKNKMKISI